MEYIFAAFIVIFFTLALLHDAEKRRIIAENEKQRQHELDLAKRHEGFLFTFQTMVDDIVAPLAAGDVPAAWKAYTKKLVTRAKATGEWQMALQVARERAEDRAQHAYAVAQLVEAHASWAKTPEDVFVLTESEPFALVANDA